VHLPFAAPFENCIAGCPRTGPLTGLRKGRMHATLLCPSTTHRVSQQAGMHSLRLPFAAPFGSAIHTGPATGRRNGRLSHPQIHPLRTQGASQWARVQSVHLHIAAPFERGIAGYPRTGPATGWPKGRMRATLAHPLRTHRAAQMVVKGLVKRARWIPHRAIQRVAH